jgi:hypothetical protein
MMRKLSAEEEGIINSHESDLGHIRRGGCLGMNDVSRFVDFLKQGNDNVCKKNGSTPLLFYLSSSKSKKNMNHNVIKLQEGLLPSAMTSLR